MALAPEHRDFADGTHEVQTLQLERMARRWRLLLRTVFLALTALVWLALVEDTANEKRITLIAVSQRDANLATAVEHYLVRVLRTAAAVHRLLGRILARGSSETELQEVLADRLRANDVFRELGLCLPDGRVLAPPHGEPRLTQERCAQITAAAPPAGELRVLPPVGSAGALDVPLVLSLDDDQGRRRALAVALVPVQRMLGIMQSAVLQDDTAVVVVGRDDLPRAAWRSQGGAVTDPAGLPAFAQLVHATGGTVQIGDREYLATSRATAESGLRVQVASAQADALSAFEARRARLIALCLLVTLAVAGVYHLLAGMQAESVERARALLRARGELEALNARLDTQVQERTAQLEQAYRDMETFSYAVAHDVRAPLAAIAGFAQALEPTLAGAGQDKPLHYLRRIQANAARMDEITAQLLALGRLTRAPLEQAVVDLGAVANEVLGELREKDPQREVSAEVDAPLRARGDRALLRQVLENLLGNAWKFTGRRPHAHIAVTRDRAAEAAGEIVVRVSDDGEGFDSAAATGLFQPFRRMHSQEEFAGSGVGLAAVQRIVALHGGRVWCESQPGQGARFFFSLPAA